MTSLLHLSGCVSNLPLRPQSIRELYSRRGAEHAEFFGEYHANGHNIECLILIIKICEPSAPLREMLSSLSLQMVRKDAEIRLKSNVDAIHVTMVGIGTSGYLQLGIFIDHIQQPVTWKYCRIMD